MGRSWRDSLYPELGRVAERRRDASGVLAFLSRRTPLLRRVPEEALRELAARAVRRRIPKSAYVCRTGDPASEIWVVEEGRLCVNQCGWRGNRLSIEVMVPGDVSGLAAVACRTYPGEVVATRESTVIAIPREAMVRAIERHPVLAREILYAYGQRINYIETLLYLSRESANDRLAAALVYLYHKFGVVLPLSRAEIAEMAGVATETAIRLLRRLQDRRLIRRYRGGVRILDLPGLKMHIAIRDTLPGPMPD